MPIWRFIKQQYEFCLRKAGTKFAEYVLYLFSALESIIIPIPVDPLLAATVLARPENWRRLAIGCTLASVVGGVAGWGIGVYFGLNINDWLALLPDRMAAPSIFASVEAGFATFGIFVVFLGAFSPLPYKIIAISAGLGGFALLPFIVTSLVGRGLRFAIVAAIVKNHGNPKFVILLITALTSLFAGAIWLTN